MISKVPRNKTVTEIFLGEIAVLASKFGQFFKKLWLFFFYLELKYII